MEQKAIFKLGMKGGETNEKRSFRYAFAYRFICFNFGGLL